MYPQGNGELPLRQNFRRPLKGCFPSSNARTSIYGTSFEWQISNGEAIDIQLNVSDARDASGKLYLPQGIFDAYRVERKVSYISKIIGGVAKTDFEDYTSYFYLDQDTEELLMEVRLEIDGSIDWIKYKSTDEGTIPTFSSSKNQFALYPSPSFGDDIRLDFRNFDKGKYSLIVYNVFGKMLWSQEYYISSDTTIRADLSFLPKGTYTYRLQDANRNTLVARRLAIINP